MKQVIEGVLYYWKCNECLYAFTLKEGIRPDVCSCGSTKLESMGRVRKSHYERTDVHAPCDERCTNAQGPLCDCGCHGCNHGTKRLVQTVIRDGKVVVVDFDEKYITQGQEFRQALKLATERFEKKFGEDLTKYRKGEWLKERNKWWQIRSADMLLRKIANYKLHKKRVEELTTFLVDQMESDKQTTELVEQLGG